MNYATFRAWIAGLVILLLPLLAWSDAIVVSQAMYANTIAEYYVEDDHVRLELEIGADDVDVFRNLMPDGFYERLGYTARPLKERAEEFFTRDLAVIADGEPLFVPATLYRTYLQCPEQALGRRNSADR